MVAIPDSPPRSAVQEALHNLRASPQGPLRKLQVVARLSPGTPRARLQPRRHSLLKNNTFERALVTMHKMPRIWIMYLNTLTEQKLLTRTRRTFDRALRSLPVTQHDRVWKHYLVFVGQTGVPKETSLRAYKRYLKYDATHVEDFVEFLLNSSLWQEASKTIGFVRLRERLSMSYGWSCVTCLLSTPWRFRCVM
ncbi:hypothetical protein TIFTF001_018900 [Ficus carica]|uniref:Pre-mRNA-splicing factor Syf1-like N-terminal HAT-repeats domain-containing protein n=1 Tax=Ficus carica TaxID=3494 RepID=A0AA88ASC5_FICCA|nr:hypothetical protein TIFTF001_018900 [Ficus carica]